MAFVIVFDGLDELLDAVETIASGEFMEDLAMDEAETASFLSRECFANDEDPNGNGWAPWAHPPTRPHVKLMVETGALVESIEARDVSKDGFSLGSYGAVGWDGRAHAHYHQEGTRIMPARKFLPEGDLPDKWLDEFEFTFAEALKDLLNA